MGIRKELEAEQQEKAQKAAAAAQASYGRAERFQQRTGGMSTADMIEAQQQRKKEKGGNSAAKG